MSGCLGTRPAMTIQKSTSIGKELSLKKINSKRLCLDTSIFDLFRPVQGICGFSRETVIAVTTNIESMEFRRRQNNSLGFEEHPRAGSTDDVEAMIGLLHRILGNVFTLKQFKYAWRNVVRYEKNMYIVNRMNKIIY